LIKNLTHDENGQAIQRLSVSTKVAVGLPPDASANRKAPMKLDFFIFLKKSNKGTGLTTTWEPDPVLTKHYGENPREVEIILLDDDLENVFPTQLAWWSATRCICKGDGENAVRKTEKNPDGEPWIPCGKMCPDLEAGRCKPSGDLRFMLADFPQLGAVARLHTTSYRSVQQVHSSLQQIQTITGGRLAGIRAMLVVRPEKTSYTASDGAKRSTIVPALSLEIKSDGIKRLVAKMTETAHLFEQTRKMLGAGKIQVLEDEDEVAREFAQEFYHQVEEDAKPKVNVRERERGTLEPGKSENRGHQKENLNPGKTIDAEPQKSAHAESVVTEKSVEKPADKPAKTPPKFEEITVEVVKVDPKMKELTEKQISENAAADAQKIDKLHDRIPYYVLQTQEHGRITVWDSKLHTAILRSQKKKCVFMVSKNSRGWVTLEEVVSIGGVAFARDPDNGQAIPADMLKVTQAVIDRNANAAAVTPAQATGIVEISGRVAEFRNKNPKGAKLASKQGAPFVTITLEFLDDDPKHDPHKLFLCTKETMFHALEQSAKHTIEFVYSKVVNSEGVLLQMIEDVRKLDDLIIKDGQQQVPIETVISQDGNRQPEEDEEDTEGLAGLFDN
jgi:hypothetical protein